ncbi:MAG: M23 family metallopeptidase [Solirubrobacterales bacterium]
MREKLANSRWSAATLVVLVAIAFASPARAADFALQGSSVSPAKAFFAAPEGVRISFRFDAADPRAVTIRIAGAAGEVRAYELPALAPGAHELSWDGLTAAGKAAPDGQYRVLIGEEGGPLSTAGSVTLYGYRYPLRARHSFRGPVGEFGAGRSGGRIHEGFDVNAACGKPLFAVRGGTVIRRRFHPRLDGNFVVIRGSGEVRTYRYSHLASPSPLRRGERVRTGDVVGRVGRTGNARSVGCHLHFEIRAGRRFIDPEPHLRRWDRYS